MLCLYYFGTTLVFWFSFSDLISAKIRVDCYDKILKNISTSWKKIKTKNLEKLNRKIKSFITLYFCTDFGLSMWTNHFNVNIRRSLSLQHQYLFKLGKYKLAFMYWPWSPDNLYIYSWAYFEHCTYVFSIYFLFAF